MTHRSPAGSFSSRSSATTSISAGRTGGSLIFDRKVLRRGRNVTPGKFRTGVITEGVTPSLHVEYQTTRIKQYHRASLGSSAPQWLSEASTELFARASSDGWAPDGEPEFVYTTDWDGRPVVRYRLHEQWWQYAREFLLDNEFGSWHHQLNWQA